MIMYLPPAKHTRKYNDSLYILRMTMFMNLRSSSNLLFPFSFISVREFVEKSFAVVGTTIKWTGPTGTVDEIGVDAADESRVLIKIDPRYFRPTEVELLLGDPTKAKNVIGWVAKTPFDELVKEMVEADVAMLKGEIVDTDRMKT